MSLPSSPPARPPGRDGALLAPGAGTRPARPAPLRVWLHAVRPHTLGASGVPVLVGAAWAARQDAFSAPVLLVCALAALALQVTTNLANDAFDFLRAVDTEERVGPLRVTQAGWLRPGQVLGGVALAIAVALVCGVYLASVGGLPIVVLGLVSIAAALGYSAGPFPLSSHGLGELAAFVFFGVVAVCGSAYLHTGGVSPLLVGVSLPVACGVSAIMVVNNLRDIESDARAGKRTLAVRMGAARTRALHVALLASAQALCLPLAYALASPLLLLPLASAPLAWRGARALLAARDASSFNGALLHTARLHLAHGVLLCLALAL